MYDLPDARGHFGPYGGVFVAETLTTRWTSCSRPTSSARKRSRSSRPSSATSSSTTSAGPARSTTRSAGRQRCGGAQIYLKREDLNHTGAHKINNTIGQALLARRMGKPRVIAETGAGMHGVATATVAARYGMECVVYMGVGGHRAPGAERLPHEAARRRAWCRSSPARRTLKDALNEAMRDWVTNVDNTFYIIGTVAGPHPYPMMVRDFQSVIGEECLRADAGARRPPARCGDRLRRRRLQRDGHFLPLHLEDETCA